MALIIGQGGETDPNALKLQTRSRNHIHNVIPLEQDDQILRRYVQKYGKEHPRVILRSVTALYNCMGLIFASRRTEIDIERVQFILKEDGYKQLADEGACFVGDIVLYGYTYDGGTKIFTHVGLVACTRQAPDGCSQIEWVLSKWSSAPEYLHRLRDVPPCLGPPLEYWTDRRMINES